MSDSDDSFTFDFKVKPKKKVRSVFLSSDEDDDDESCEENDEHLNITKSYSDDSELASGSASNEEQTLSEITSQLSEAHPEELASTPIKKETKTPLTESLCSPITPTSSQKRGEFSSVPNTPSTDSENEVVSNSSESVVTRSPSPEVRAVKPGSLQQVGESNDDDVIDVSDDDDLHTRYADKPGFSKSEAVKQDIDHSETIEEKARSQKDDGDLTDYTKQYELVQKLQSEIQIVNNTLRTAKLNLLADGGQSIRDKRASLEKQLLEVVSKLSLMEEQKKPSTEIPSWQELQAKAVMVQPKTFGAQAMSTYNDQKCLMMDRLHQLHDSLKTCPSDKDVEEDPQGLRVGLMEHQKRALSWSMWREKQTPSGGILADDMGLGKTLTMIALVMKSIEHGREKTDSHDKQNKDSERSDKKYNGGTLIVCPASLLNQWSGEIDRRTKRGKLSYEVYHGKRRETMAKRLAQYNIVITTYSIVMNENSSEGILFKVKWRRIVLDEAHQIRNFKSQTSEAVCRLAAKSRWALTGTPVHNKELDMYALLKFLRCTPFDDLQVWRRWVGVKGAGGEERLHTVVSSIMLRRTKPELIEKGLMNTLPERKWELVNVGLSKKESDIYHRILVFSRTLFAQFLKQRADKNYDMPKLQLDANSIEEENAEYFKMRKKFLGLRKHQEIKQTVILVLLLRLRQICCHPCLIKTMLNGNIGEVNDVDDELDLLEQLNKLDISDGTHSSENSIEHGEEKDPDFNTVAMGLLNPSNPMFSKATISSKIKSVLQVLKEKVNIAEDKVVIVSQWPTFLDIVGHFLKEEGYRFSKLDGSVPVQNRMEMVDNFNNPKHRVRVLLLSLTAGGVGLNLVGANHLFLLDPHWNPQLENQAQDRVYRVGQQKPVFIYKYLVSETIEGRILNLQQQKLQTAENMLMGSKQATTSKLSLQDLRNLFEV